MRHKLPFLVIPWLAAGAIVLRFWWVLSRLPERMVIHFDAAGQPNGWLPPLPFLVVMAAFLLCELGIFSFFLLRMGEDRSQFAALLVLFYVFTAGEVTLFWELLDYNLGHGPMAWGTVAMATGALGILPAVLVLATLRRRRGQGHGEAPLAVETHRSSRRFWINLPFCLGLVLGWVVAPDLLWKGIVAYLALVVGYFMWLIWSGFRYRFLPSGVEIAGPLGRLGFVPRDAIVSAEVREIRPVRQFGGWGIRGGGGRRAYIWEGRRALCLRLRHGEVYLGHAEPERLLGHLQGLQRAAPG